jgi:hypothetical protein
MLSLKDAKATPEIKVLNVKVGLQSVREAKSKN